MNEQTIRGGHTSAAAGRQAEKIAIQVGKLQVAAQSLYDLGVSLRDALRMTNLTPDQYEFAFSHYDGILEEPTVRTALRSGCWRFRLEDAGMPSQVRVILPLGPYKTEMDRNADRKLPWMQEWLIRPFGFKRIADEVGVGADAGSYYECYAANWPVPAPALRRIIKLLRVPRAARDSVREHEAYELLTYYFNQPQP